MNNLRKIAISNVTFNGRKYIFKKKLIITIEDFIANEVLASSDKLAIFGCGKNKSIDSALKNFNELFDFQYRNLVECPEETLTKDALVLRQTFLDLVEKVSEPQE